MRVSRLHMLALLAASGLVGIAPQAMADGGTERLPPPDRYFTASEAPWLIRGQAAAKLAKIDSAGTFADVKTGPMDVVPPAPPAYPAAYGADCGAPCADNCCDCGYGSWWDNTALFFAADSWRTRADDDYPGNFGFRSGFNSGIGWWESPIRVQFGASYGVYDISGRDGDGGADPTSNAQAEEQIFFTAGVYKRSDICCGDRIAWGVVIDNLYDDNFGEEANEIFLTQFRGIAGYALNECNEIGVWGTLSADGDRITGTDRGAFSIRAIDQLNVFWHHNWAFGGDTWLSAGFADEPVEWVLSLTGTAPLSQSVALFGGVTWGIPSATTGDPTGGGQEYSEEYYNVSFGIVWYPGCKASNSTVSGYSGMPLLPVADNGSFLVKAPTGNL